MPTLGSTVLLQQWTTGAHSTGCWSNEPWLANVSEHQLLHDKAKVTHTPLASADLWLEQGVQSMVRFSEECIWPDSTVILQSSTEHKRRYQLSLCQAPQLQSFTRRLHTALCPEHSEQYQTAVTPRAANTSTYRRCGKLLCQDSSSGRPAAANGVVPESASRKSDRLDNLYGGLVPWKSAAAARSMCCCTRASASAS